MTRFARAEGSKSSNKRQYEEASSWAEIKEDMAIPRSKQDPTNSKMHSKRVKKDSSNKAVYILEDGQKLKVFKDGKKKTWLNIVYHECEDMTKYEMLYVKPEAVAALNEQRQAYKNEGLEYRWINRRMFTLERRAHIKLRVELMRKQISLNKKEKKTAVVSSKKNKSVKPEIESAQMIEKFSAEEKNESMPGLKFEENHMMTQFESFWVLKSSVQYLKDVYEIKVDYIRSNRTDGNEDTELTEEEKATLIRLMKKEKRREHSFLCSELWKSFHQRGQCHSVQKLHHQKHFGSGNVKRRQGIVKFDGFNVKEEAAQRLTLLGDKLRARGCNSEEIRATLQSERRIEERYLKRENKVFCYKCRTSGHTLSHCPEANEADICYKCGSTEHMARDCQSNSGSSIYNYATCFHCQKTGHIARQCPGNPNGMYPNGGFCYDCGAVDHLQLDCPVLQDRLKNVTLLTADVLKPNQNIEEIDFSYSADVVNNNPKVSKKKHIFFD